MDGRRALKLYLLVILAFTIAALCGCAARQPSSTDRKPQPFVCDPDIIELGGHLQELCCWSDAGGTTHCRFVD
jgi:hypothetical protein